jgi:AraC-like DNA-binding protein
MSVLQFNIPPFPTFIRMGEAIIPKGKKHFKRTFVVFDLIYVSEGCLYIAEDKNEYEVEKGQYIILSPGLEHYGYKGCTVETSYYWVHFKIEGNYRLTEPKEIDWRGIRVKEGDFIEPHTFLFQIPSYGSINHSSLIERLFDNMLQVNNPHSPDFPLRQQIYFDEIILQLQKEAMRIPTATERVTEQTIQYIQVNYKNDIKMDDIANELHFHSDYITRCMQKTIGMSPIHYLNHFRIAQAKRLLATTNDKVMVISKSVGIEDHTYFSKLFKKTEGLSPSEYRQLLQREG